MQYVCEEHFHFLEQSTYFYEKTIGVARKGSEELKQTIEEDKSHIIYVFFDQDNPSQAIAEISIPIKNPNEDVKWKFLQLNEDAKKPIYQSVNPNIEKMPNWFKSLVLEALSVYERVVILFRLFGPV